MGCNVEVDYVYMEKGWLLKIVENSFNYHNNAEDLKFCLIYDDEEYAVAEFPLERDEKGYVLYPDPEKAHEWGWEWEPCIGSQKVEYLLGILRG